MSGESLRNGRQTEQSRDKINPLNEVSIMKKLTIKILFALALVVGTVTGSMVLTGVSGQPTVQACPAVEC